MPMRAARTRLMAANASGVLCVRPTMVLSTEQASGETYTTLPSRARGQVRQPVATAAPKGRRRHSRGYNRWLV